ncbi:MAG: PEP-CTERM sorting domain-containing protein [Acidobacteria bacterium]|nr:PEP-CTERM sorting domain-containing protein [Acidobacteriota bacterium]MCL5286737.1 PEP-CTERM sorting domain-containing protein [Acidobacteriota bacterium]
MNLRKPWLLLTILLLAPAVHADSVTMQFVGVNGAQGGGYYVSPYYATMNGSPVTLFCVDIANTVHWNQVWQANLSTITNGSNLSDTRYGSLPQGLALYQQAAWLISQFPTNSSDYVNLQYALWNLFNPSLAPDSSGSNAWLALAAANFSSINFANFRVVTNVAPVYLTGQVQEFIIIVPPGQVPEPATLALFGTGLIAVATLVRRRTRTSQNSTAQK